MSIFKLDTFFVIALVKCDRPYFYAWGILTNWSNPITTHQFDCHGLYKILW